MAVEELLTIEVDGSRVFKVIAVSGEHQQRFVVDSDVTIIKGLGARFEKLKVAREDFEEESLLFGLCEICCEAWAQDRGLLSLRDKHGNFVSRIGGPAVTGRRGKKRSF